MTAIAQAGDVVAFWRDAGPERWFNRDSAFDEDIRRRFFAAYEAGARGELHGWSDTPEGALALVILLDQFPRNMFRGQARAFETDPLACAVAKRALARGDDRKIDASMRGFFFLPFMHSEDLADQEHCVALYQAANDENGLKYAREHADIIRRFGRFPHRNRALNRTTTIEEQAFLDGGGFSG
jgi:uncharacterized protein (DUF924 family)